MSPHSGGLSNPANESQNKRMSVVVTHTLDDLGKSNILPHVGNLDADALALFGVGNNNDETALDPGNTVALVANIFDFDGALFAFLDRGRLCRLFGLWIGFSLVGLVDRNFNRTTCGRICAVYVPNTY